MEKSVNCSIEYYEIDLKEEDWTLDSDMIDEQGWGVTELQ